MRILVLERNGSDIVGEPHNYYGFYHALAKQAEVVFAGEGYPDHKPNESLAETIARLGPFDWVIDRDYNLEEAKLGLRDYRIGLFVSDLHGKWHYGAKTPMEHISLLNGAGYDAIFMRYPGICGTDDPVNIYELGLRAERHWIPWSVDTEFFTPAIPYRDRAFSAVFLGAIYDCYPLRKVLYEKLGEFCKWHGYWHVVAKAPEGPVYEQRISQLMRHHYVGQRYANLLADAKVNLFDCSIYRYPLMRFFESMASGCLVLSDMPLGSEKLGFNDVVGEIGLGNWPIRLEYYLENPLEAEKMARKGVDLARTRHSHEVRARQFLEVLKR